VNVCIRCETDVPDNQNRCPSCMFPHVKLKRCEEATREPRKLAPRDRPGYDSYELIGVFESDGTLVISDPCYEPGAWCSAMLTDCETGTWTAVAMIGDEGRVSALVAVSNALEDPIAQQLKDRKFIKVPGVIGVDAGLCGIFPAKTFNKKGKWQSIVDTFISERDMHGRALDGVWSSTGYGDGSYNLYYAENASGDVNTILVTFIEEGYEDVEL
jgi:hypothetical protein